MKIQCSCGAKFSFDVTPQMMQGPVHFVCSSCGLDASEYVTNLVREQFATAPPPTPEPLPAPVAHAAPRPEVVIPASPPKPRLHVARVVHASEPAPSATSDVITESTTFCLKHGGQETVDKCYVCQKPICPECMAIFGYVCSPLCKAKADSHGIDIPIFEGQRSVIEARHWRKVTLVSSVVGAICVLLFGAWIWYRFFGSAPKTVFSVRFPELAHSGQSFIIGNQIVFLRGGTFARYDMNSKKEVWSRYLIDKSQIDKKIAETLKQTEKLIFKANNEAWEHVPKMPDPIQLAKSMERSEAAELQLKVRGQNLWIMSSGKLTRYDFDSGQPVKELALKNDYGQIVPRGSELLLVDEQGAAPVITHVNLETAESRVEDFNLKQTPGTTNTLALLPQQRSKSAPLAGIPGKPGAGQNQGLDPNRVAEQAQHMSLPQRLALPAVLSNARTQERELKELNDQDRTRPQGDDFDTRDGYSLLPTANGLVQFSVHLIERKVIARSAVKAPKGKSALDSAPSVANSTEMANEILNEMQRDRGGDTIEEDESRYRVTVRSADGKDSWTGEVVGQPSIYPLQTVSVVTANKMLIVLDKNYKKLWQNSLTYDVQGGLSALDADNAPNGQGPCVEHKNGLFVIDEGVLTAFDLMSGNARWRFPSVGISGIFFDDKDAMYVNTTSAGIERVKYSRQIDVGRKDLDVIVKLDSRSGKVLWKTEPGGLVNYVSGKYLYTVQFYQPYEPDEDDPYSQEPASVPPYLRIKRINPRTGSVLWEHFQQRAPLDVQFDKNTIRLVFRKEVQVLRFLSL